MTAALDGEPFGGRLRLRTAAGANDDRHGTGQALSREPDHYAVWLRSLRDGGHGAGRCRDTFRLLAAVSRDCFYELTVEVDCRLRLAWADPRLVELTGYDLDELQAMGGFFGVVAAADGPGCTGAINSCWPGRAVPIRYRLRRKTGELRWVQDSARALREAEGGRGRAHRRHARGRERGLAHSLPAPWLEQEAAMIAELMQAGLALLDGEGRVLWASDAAGRPAAAAGRHSRSLPCCRRSLLAPWLDWLDEALVARQPVRCRLAWAGPTGTSRSRPISSLSARTAVQLVAWPAAAAPMAPTRAARAGGGGRAGTADVTAEQRQILAGRGDEQRRRRDLLLLDPEGRITWLSRSAEAIFDIRATAPIGASARFLLPPGPDTGGALLERLRAPPAGKAPFELTDPPPLRRAGAGRGRERRRRSSAGGR